MIIGIDLGGMSAKAAILSEGKLIGKSRVETSAEKSVNDTALSLVKLCMETAEKAGKSFESVQAIGIGSPGFIDSATGTVVSWTNFGWRNVPLAELVKKYSGKPVFVTNDANAAALGEAKYGAGKRYSDSVLVTIGTGVGGGVVIGGKLFEGFRSAGTEVGHMIIRQNGELCSCGRKGCYERYASARALLRMTREAMADHPESAMWKYAETLEKVDGRTVFFAMQKDDAAAKKVFEEYIANLGEGIINLVNVLRPQAVILGGGLSAEGETLLAPLRKFISPRIFVSESEVPLDLLCAELGNDAGLYGAAQFAMEKL